MSRKDNYSGKPNLNKGGTCHDGNIKKKFPNDYYRDTIFKFQIGHSESFNGFSGTTEFSTFPIRQLFLNTHKMLPSEWDTGYISYKDVEEYVLKNKNKILASHYGLNKEISNCLMYIGGKECVYVYIYNRGYKECSEKYGVCLIFKRKTKLVEKLMDYFIKITIPKIEETESYLNILIKDSNGFDLEKCEINKPEIDFDVNYNEDFKPINDSILDKLSIKNSKGLVLLHGLPGTGKTTYIRYLINALKKKVIYIPPAMADVLSDPSLIKFFITHSNSILVIEDAENVLMRRNSNSSQAIANILNLTDGLLSDCANIQIVCTFNTDILNIDEALLRKGRLIAKYEFKQLNEERTLKLSKKLGVEINGKHALADIYNSNENTFIKKPKKIGF